MGERNRKQEAGDDGKEIPTWSLSEDDFEVCAPQYTPHHDENGFFVRQDGTKVKLCDCLRISCSGCHPVCKDCGSRMCGPACQKGRDYVPLTIGCRCGPIPPRYHPFLEKCEPYCSSCDSDDI